MNIFDMSEILEEKKSIKQKFQIRIGKLSPMYLLTNIERCWFVDNRLEMYSKQQCVWVWMKPDPCILVSVHELN